MTRPASRSIEAKAKFLKKKKHNVKGTALEKWINIIEPLCEPYPDCIKNHTVETILDLEFRDPKTERNRKRAKLPPLTEEMLEN